MALGGREGVRAGTEQRRDVLDVGLVVAIQMDPVETIDIEAGARKNLEFRIDASKFQLRPHLNKFGAPCQGGH